MQTAIIAIIEIYKVYANVYLYLRAKLLSHWLLHFVQLCLNEMYLHLYILHPIVHCINISKQFSVEHNYSIY